MTLEEVGHVCVECNDPKEALQMMEEKSFELLLLDHHMPGMNSLELMQAMKAKGFSLPTIVVTSEREESIFSYCIELGALDFLSKPISPALLARRVEVALVQTAQLEPALSKELEQNRRSSRLISPFQRQGALTGQLNSGLGESKDVVLMSLEIHGHMGWLNELSEDGYGELMSDLYGLFSQVLDQHGGWIETFGEGGLRAVFEGLACENRALRASVGIQEELFNYNRSKKDSDVVGLEVGVSVHSGRVKTGAFGGKEHLAPTLLGTPLIICKEMERLNRRFKARVLVSEAVLSGLDREEFPLRDIDLLPLSFKSKPIGIYEVFASDPPQIRELKSDNVSLFTCAVQDFRERRFEMALRAFGECFSINDSDGVSLEYIHRCHYFVNHPPREESWLHEIGSLQMQDWSVRRRYVRKPCNMPLQVHSWFKGDEGLDFSGSLCDVSIGGARAYFEKPVRAGDSLLISLNSPEGEVILRLAGRVAWMSKEVEKSHQPHEVGLEILALSLESQGNLKHWVGSLGRSMTGRGDEHVLLVDQDREAAEKIRDVLSPDGFEVDQLDDIDHLFGQLGKAAYCLVLIDLPSFGERAMEALVKLKTEAATAELPVMVMGCDENEPDLITCLEKGADNFIKKPFSPLLFKGRVLTTLGSSRQREEQVNRLLTTQRRLRDHVFQTEVALRAKSAFISTVNHELRTPLNGILGAASILKSGSQEELPELDLIERSGLQLLEVLNGMLAMVNQNTEGELQLSPCWIRQELQETTKTLMLKKPQELSFQVRFDMQRDSHVLCDKGKLKQILYNLVDNAFKFTSKGHVDLSIKVLKESEKEIVLRFDVKDDGMGIRPGDLERIFAPFTQADQGLNREHEGMGLGLAISSKLASLMGTKIECSSEQGEGSHFWLELKLDKEELTSFEEETQTEILSDEEEKTGMRIMVAEDNEENQLLLKAFFKKLDLEFDLASNGRIAYDMARNKCYDLILMDIHMPEMDGLEATRLIREHEEKVGQRSSIVALTALSMPEDRERCFDAGMDEHLSKPIQFKTLKNFLGKGFKI